MSLTKVIPRIPALKATYRTGRVLSLPVNITVSGSYRCNSRCKTCNVWLLPNDDMTLEDLRRAHVVFPYYSSAYAVGDFVDLIASYNRSIRRVAEAEGVPLVDLAKEIDGRPDRRRLFLDTMHPNQQGRELIAEILARRLRESGVLGS